MAPRGFPAPSRNSELWRGLAQYGRRGGGLWGVGNHLTDPRCRSSSHALLPAGQHQDLHREGGCHQRRPSSPPVFREMNTVVLGFWPHLGISSRARASPRPRPATPCPGPCVNPLLFPVAGTQQGRATQEGAGPATAYWQPGFWVPEPLPFLFAGSGEPGPLPQASPTPTACSLPGWIRKSLPPLPGLRCSPMATASLLAATGPPSGEPTAGKWGSTG